MDTGEWLIVHDDDFFTPLGELGRGALSTVGGAMGAAIGAVAGGGAANIPGATILGSIGAVGGEAAGASAANGIESVVGSWFSL